MSNLKEYNELIERKKKVEQAIKIFEESEIIKNYLELTTEQFKLEEQRQNSYRNIKMEEYAICKHISVFSNIEHNRYGTFPSCGCIKCGLNNNVLYFPRENLSFENQIMYDYLKRNVYKGKLKGINTEIECDLDLAQAIYSKIKAAHPNIDDKTTTKYFEIALDNMRKIEVNEERRVSRAKRLSLKPNFNRWNGKDVHDV